MSRQYQQARFLASAATLEQLPPDLGFEIAFAGRSNAGKSSAINALCGQKALARTSKTPGRTRLINFFRIDDQRRLVDLPGYGYAKAPESIKAQWQGLLERYLSARECLRGLVLLMDCRHPLTEYDRRMLEWNTHHGLPSHILLTKADKLGQGAAATRLLEVQRETSRLSPEISVQTFSALKHRGLDNARRVLDRWLGFEASA